jgi:phosphohistidine phosphatase SixA
MLYLIRHAKAGSRVEWEGDDSARPLTGKGRRQSIALAERLASLATGTLVSSPTARCLQTIEPLAKLRGVEIVTDKRLAEGAGFEGTIELLATLPEGSALCSHGDVIPEVIAALERRGCVFEGELDFRKATVWELRRGDDGSITEGTAWPPPPRR